MRAARGFTLIEIVVVLLIIGILASVLAISITSRPLDETQHIEAQRLQQLLALAASQAQLQSIQIGLLIGSDGYRFLHLNNQRQWVPYTDGPLRLRKLPQPFGMRLHIDRHAVTAHRLLNPSATDDSTDAAATTPDDGNTPKYPTPQIVLLSSGETTAFKLAITAPNSDLIYQVSANDLGDIKLQRITLQ